MSRAPFEMPTAATVLSVLGMTCYPVAVVGLAFTVGQGYSPIAGWVIAVAGAVGAMIPMWLRDLSGQQTARDLRPAGPVEAPPGQIQIRAATVNYPQPQGLPAAGPAVARPYDD